MAFEKKHAEVRKSKDQEFPVEITIDLPKSKKATPPTFRDMIRAFDTTYAADRWPVVKKTVEEYIQKMYQVKKVNRKYYKILRTTAVQVTFAVNPKQIGGKPRNSKLMGECSQNRTDQCENENVFKVDEWRSVAEARNWLIKEGLYDQGIFKAVFMAGTPGAGKSFTASKLALSALGLRTINSDNAFEHALKKAGQSLKVGEIDPEVRDSIRGQAKITTSNMLDISIQNRLGLVIDGTARDPEKIARMKKLLEELGYETKMIFVSTDLQTSLERNARRARTVPEKIVKSSYNQIQKGKRKLISLFGTKNFIEIENSGTIEDLEQQTLQAFKKLKGWSVRIPSNKMVDNWISQAKATRNIK